MEAPATPPLPETPFVNEVRLNGKKWLIALALIAVAFVAIPRLWKSVETFETGRDYRIPYALSKDYWLYERRLANERDPSKIFILGDSVVWGEYVLPDGTLSHFLNEQTGATDRFINAGVNGLYPLAIEGLARDYAPLRDRKVILHCNLLWMSSPKADLQENKAQQLNHSRLLPQFHKIPSYKADANERLSASIERHVQFFSWVTHLQSAYFNDKSIPAWTLADDGADPPQYPNAYKNPPRQITLRVPSAPADDPERGPASPRHQPWFKTGATPTGFEWVAPEQSLQLAAFHRTIQKLRARGNNVLVVVGPFNEHIIAPESKPGFENLRSAVVAFLRSDNIPFAIPQALGSNLYADGSHPLTEGYKALARELLNDAGFSKWLAQ
jgi:hypothetical protein